jgi:hypothetical protein
LNNECQPLEGFRFHGWRWENPIPLGVDLTAVVRLKDRILIGGTFGVLFEFDGLQFRELSTTALTAHDSITALAAVPLSDGGSVALASTSAGLVLQASPELDDGGLLVTVEFDAGVALSGLVANGTGGWAFASETRQLFRRSQSATWTFAGTLTQRPLSALMLVDGGALFGTINGGYLHTDVSNVAGAERCLFSLGDRFVAGSSLGTVKLYNSETSALIVEWNVPCQTVWSDNREVWVATPNGSVSQLFFDGGVSQPLAASTPVTGFESLRGLRDERFSPSMLWVGSAGFLATYGPGLGLQVLSTGPREAFTAVVGPPWFAIGSSSTGSRLFERLGRVWTESRVPPNNDTIAALAVTTQPSGVLWASQPQGGLAVQRGFGWEFRPSPRGLPLRVLAGSANGAFGAVDAGRTGSEFSFLQSDGGIVSLDMASCNPEGRSARALWAAPDSDVAVILTESGFRVANATSRSCRNVSGAAVPDASLGVALSGTSANAPVWFAGPLRAQGDFGALSPPTSAPLITRLRRNAPFPVLDGIFTDSTEGAWILGRDVVGRSWTLRVWLDGGTDAPQPVPAASLTGVWGFNTDAGTELVVAGDGGAVLRRSLGP